MSRMRLLVTPMMMGAWACDGYSHVVLRGLEKPLEEEVAVSPQLVWIGNRLDQSHGTAFLLGTLWFPNSRPCSASNARRIHHPFLPIYTSSL